MIPYFARFAVNGCGGNWPNANIRAGISACSPVCRVSNLTNKEFWLHPEWPLYASDSGLCNACFWAEHCLIFLWEAAVAF
jgi:hypothetical protein